MKLDYPETIEDLNKLPEIDKLTCKEVAQWKDEWIKSILPENNKLSLKFKKWNKEFKGKLRGKMVPIIGYGGTKKSLLSLNIAYENITQGLGRCIYSTMEMGATELINRLIDMITVPNDNYNPHLELEYHHNRKNIDADEFYRKKISPYLRDSFFITENTAMRTEQYDKLLNDFKAKNKPVDILVVDGLSGMGGSGTETELYSRHSKELKDLANKYKILVFLICHVSKGGKKTDRDLSRLVRSSEKIIDNCDFYITASLFESEHDEYNKTNGALRLVNKRGSGNVLDVVYSFDRLRLLMEETDMDFNQFELGTPNTF